MKAILVTPTPRGVQDGNLMTAQRWARMLRRLGHKISVGSQYCGESADLLIALHAFKSRHSICRFHERYPDKPLIVVLSGTDLYRDLLQEPETVLSLRWATHLVVLQRQALSELPESLRRKTSVIYQSAAPVKGCSPPRSYFRVAVVGNLRPEKDPFRTALAGRRLPTLSRVRIWHVGQALNPEMQRKALIESQKNPRYRWLGPLPHWRTRRLIASSHLVALTSRMEGSSNVLSEALVSSVPVIASKIPGLIGTLGKDYPGYFPVGDTKALIQHLTRAETEPDFYHELREHCLQRSRLVQPEREKSEWEVLLDKVRK